MFSHFGLTMNFKMLLQDISQIFMFNFLIKKKYCNLRKIQFFSVEFVHWIQI